MVVVAMFAWPSRICTLEAVLQQPGRIAVAQAVRRNALDAGRLGHLPKGGMERIDPDVLAMKPGRKQPAGIAVGQPEPAQLIEHRLRQRHTSLLVAFPDDAQQLIGLVNRTDFERYRLADA